jgi:hypothetical protein
LNLDLTVGQQSTGLQLAQQHSGMVQFDPVQMTYTGK